MHAIFQQQHCIRNSASISAQHVNSNSMRELAYIDSDSMSSLAEIVNGNSMSKFSSLEGLVFLHTYMT